MQFESVDNLPCGWKRNKLRKFCKLASGGTPNRTKDEYWDGNIPWATTAEVKYGVIEDTNEHITELGLSKSAAKTFPAGTLIMAMYGQGVTRGRVALLGNLMAINQACVAIIPKSEEYLSRYLYYYLTFYYHKIRSFSQGSNQLNLSSDLVGAFPVSIPSVTEQDKIVEILSTWDTAISQTRDLLAAKQRRKKALMQLLLTGKTRMPGFGKPTQDKTELAEGWKWLPLSEVFSRVTRTATEAPADVLSITATVGFVHQKDKFSKVIAGNNLKNYVLLKRGEFAYNKGNSKSYPQGCIYRLEEYQQAAVPNVYFCFTSKSDSAVGDFYKYYFESGLLNGQLARVINTGVRNDGLLNLNPNDFFKVKILLPPKKEQIAIADILSTATNETIYQKDLLARLEQQKRGLMQKLLTGEIPVQT